MRQIKKKLTYDVPILFVIFRRSDEALRVIDAIAKVKPKRLYISQDGPRNKNEERDVLETKEAVLAKINWNCDLTVWTHNKNLGLKKHIPQAFNKFFEKEEYGIYLEDDTLPSEDFFYFEQELLKKYKNDYRIFSISGTNLYSEFTKTNYSYYLSKIGSVWGFGLWKRSWDLYDVNMTNFINLRNGKRYKSLFFNKKYRFYLESLWKSIKTGQLDSWAMQLVYAAISNDMYFLTPRVNLVSNIGVNKKGSNPSLQNYVKGVGNILPLERPGTLEYKKDNDAIYFSNMLRGGWLRLLLMKAYLSLPRSIKFIMRRYLEM